jgi:hypothetical protein
MPLMTDDPTDDPPTPRLPPSPRLRRTGRRAG